MSTKLDLLISQMNAERMTSAEQMIGIAEKYGLVEERVFQRSIVFNSEYGIVCADLKWLEFYTNADWDVINGVDWTEEDFEHSVYCGESNNSEKLDEDFENGVINMGELKE